MLLIHKDIRTHHNTLVRIGGPVVGIGLIILMIYLVSPFAMDVATGNTKSATIQITDSEEKFKLKRTAYRVDYTTDQGEAFSAYSGHLKAHIFAGETYDVEYLGRSHVITGLREKSVDAQDSSTAHLIYRITVPGLIFIFGVGLVMIPICSALGMRLTPKGIEFNPSPAARRTYLITGFVLLYGSFVSLYKILPEVMRGYRNDAFVIEERTVKAVDVDIMKRTVTTTDGEELLIYGTTQLEAGENYIFKHTNKMNIVLQIADPEEIAALKEELEQEAKE